MRYSYYMIVLLMQCNRPISQLTICMSFGALFCYTAIFYILAHHQFWRWRSRATIFAIL